MSSSNKEFDGDSIGSSDSLDIESGNRDPKTQNPQAYVPSDNEDRMSELSHYASTPDQSLKMVRTETKKSLKDLGVSDELPTLDPNRPIAVENPIFPEEYYLETETGLVPVATLQDLGRNPTAFEKLRKEKSRAFPQPNGEAPIFKDSSDVETFKSKEYSPEIEFVTFLINDPDNPYNWPTFTKWAYVIILSILVVAVAFGSSCISGALFTVEDNYNVSLEVAILTVSLMVLGFSLGPLLWSPLSEQIGRRWVYFISLGLYTIFNIPCALSPNIGGLLVCRFLCGVFSSSALCLVGGSIADMHPSETRGKAIAYFAAAPYGGPVIGPLVCGWIGVKTNRMDLIFWVNMGFAGFMWLLVACIPETYQPVILKNRAKKLRMELNNPNIMTEQEANPLTFKELVVTCLYRPLMFVFTEPVLDMMCVYVCLIYSLLYAFFFAYPVIFNELYGYEDDFIGLMLIPILIGAFLALVTTPILESMYVKMCQRRKPTPEDRLVGAMIGSPFPAIALFILGATSYKHIIWVGPASSGIAFGYGMVLIYYSLNNYIIDTYAKYAASALATKVFLRSAGGAAFPLFTTQMYHKLGLQWASWLLAFISLAMILIPFVFYIYGARLRAKMCKENYSEM
ncbi:spermine transporter [Komagataella kurtzmanii]|nr:spermine transporter [Komagataella kurtzmanii]